MRAKLQKWGNSLALRIPKSLAEDVKLGQGSEVDVFSDGERIVVEPQGKFALSDLLKGITAENTHGEIDSGKPKGKEVW